MDVKIFLYNLILMALILMGSNVAAMIAESDSYERFPTLKRLASASYWNNTDQLPSQEKINNEVEVILIAYTPLTESTIDNAFKNALFLKDAVRISECRQFIKEQKLEKSEANVFFTGLKNGIVINPGQLMKTDFYAIKKRRIKEYADKVNMRQEELAIDITYNDSEEWAYACGGR